jgi:hypothetical protein
MPVDMPQNRKTPLATKEPSSDWVTRTLNWSAFLIALGLCLWIINYSVESTEYTYAPLSSGVASAEE